MGQAANENSRAEASGRSAGVAVLLVLFGFAPLAIAGLRQRSALGGAIALLSLIWIVAYAALAAISISAVSTAGDLDSLAALWGYVLVDPIRIAAAFALLFGGMAFIASIAIAFLDREARRGATLFHSFYAIVAAVSAAFSALTSFLGVQVIFESETATFFSTTLLPFGLSVFIFVYALALWMGGSDLIRRSYWAASGPLALLERFFKWALLALPAVGLFVLSTWTSALGLGGRDAVRIHYGAEVERLLADCDATASFRAREDEFLANLEITVRQLKDLADQEAERGVISGVAGAGDVVDYVRRLSSWLAGVTEEAALKRDDGALERLCEKSGDALLKELGKVSGGNFKSWERRFIDRFDALRLEVNTARTSGSPISFVRTQLANMDTTVVRPQLSQSPQDMRLRAAIDAYADRVQDALEDLVLRFGSAPEGPRPATRVWSVSELFGAETVAPPSPTTVPPLAVISARYAIWQYGAQLFDIWAFAICWDFSSYLLMIVYILFPQVGRLTPPASGDESGLGE